MKRVDILVPIFNGLTYVKDCVESVLNCTDPDTYILWLLDDGSDATTAEYLEAIADEHEQINYVRNSENLGFVKNCNQGFINASLEWCVLLNSDVIVTKGWLEKLLICGDSEEQIAAVNPLTNQASQINVPMAPGANFEQVNEFFGRLPLPENGYPDIVTGVGFCIMLRRSVIEKLGLFDEVYGKGYCEESDLCMRLTTQGYRVVISPNVYVYHKGRGTFTDRGERYKHNRKIFDQRWEQEYRQQFSRFAAENPIEPYRNVMVTSKRWDPILGARMAVRNVLSQFAHKNYLNTVKAMIRGGYDAVTTYSTNFNYSDLSKFKPSKHMSVTYVLHNLTVAGGVLSVVQIVNQLIKQGVDARIVALREYPEIYNWQLLVRPIIYKSVDDLIEFFPKSDIVVATHWTTASWVKEVHAQGRAEQAVYFLQDYEPWFYPESDVKARQTVADTFSWIKHKIVKSDWLSGMMQNDGFGTEKIRLGMNLDVFYPRAVPKPKDRVRILAMARPRTPRRGYADLIKALDLVWKEVNGQGIEIVFFGEESLPFDGDFPFTNAGVISNQSLLAELYSSCDIYIDSSVFQGFGRPALEAMACGAACVVTNVGGVNEYANDGVNCLAVRPSEPVAIAESVVRLIRDESLRQSLIEEGLKTAQLFCHKREGRETFEFFRSLTRMA